MRNALAAWARGESAAAERAVNKLCAEILAAEPAVADDGSWAACGARLFERAAAVAAPLLPPQPPREPLDVLLACAARAALLALQRRGIAAWPGLSEAEAAFTALTAADPRLGQVAVMHAFGGLSAARIARALGQSERAVGRDLAKLPATLRPQIA